MKHPIKVSDNRDFGISGILRIKGVLAGFLRIPTRRSRRSGKADTTDPFTYYEKKSNVFVMPVPSDRLREYTLNGEDVRAAHSSNSISGLSTRP